MRGRSSFLLFLLGYIFRSILFDVSVFFFEAHAWSVLFSFLFILYILYLYTIILTRYLSTCRRVPLSMIKYELSFHFHYMLILFIVVILNSVILFINSIIFCRSSSRDYCQMPVQRSTSDFTPYILIATWIFSHSESSPIDGFLYVNTRQHRNKHFCL